MTQPNSGPTQFVRADGEKIRHLQDVHVPHPEAPATFQRSALLVGSRGAGKTTLLRHRRETRHPGAVYVNLWKALYPITRDAGLGGRSLEFSVEQTRQIQAKTAALIAATVLENVLRNEPEGSIHRANLSILDAVLPVDLRSTENCNIERARAIRNEVEDLAVGQWWTTPSDIRLIDTLLEISAARDTETLLFFDRAEDAPSACIRLLTPVFHEVSDGGIAA